MMENRGSGRCAPTAAIAVAAALALTSIAATGLFAGNAVAQDGPQSILDCMRVEDDTLRLACFDSFAKQSGNQSKPAVAPVPVPETAVVPVPATSPVPVQAPVTPREKFGNPPPPPPPKKQATKPAANARDDFGDPPLAEEERKAELKSIEVVIIRGRQNMDGKWRLVTEDGQNWWQIGDGRLRLRRFPARATITKALLGSYFLQLESGGQRIRVRRKK